MTASNVNHTGADSDVNLLFGVLALQADLIDGERFVQACTLWAARKDRPLGALLVEQGWLSEQDRADVERLLARKLRRHKGDARASLAEAAGGQARAALARIADPEVERSLAGLDTVAPAAEDGAAEQPGGRAGRNELYEEIGRGGMGMVRRGRDPALGRELAVKVLLPRHQGDAGLERRFVSEAQITGQLQHPGVVPIYELGEFADRRPYFTMKLIKGQTLSEMLGRRPDAGQELPRYLGIFEQVCQALAYAHSKRVIHRDLKPANVMVGAFGEVQVMDWGLARVLGRREPEDPEETSAGTLIRTTRSDSTAEGEGRTGVVGTPAYMAPEQARGEEVDERADVFGLGAILCVILTGNAPFAGSSSEEALRQASMGEMSEALARLKGSGAEAELLALARSCLAARREDRPRHAGEVAQRLTAYLAGVQERLRQAGLERAAAEARAEEEARTRRVAEAKATVEQRARRLTASLAALVLVLLLLVGGGAIGLWQQQRHQAGAAATLAMNEAKLLGEQGRFGEALAAARKAEELARTAGATEAVRREAAELAEAIEKEEAAAQRDRRLLAALLEVRGPREVPRLHTDEHRLMMMLAQPSADEQFARAFREWDATFDVDKLSAAEAAARLKARPAVQAEVVAALDEWASERRRQGMAEARWRRLSDLATALDDPGTTRQGELRRLMAGGTLQRERALGLLALALRPVPVPFDAGLGQDRQRLRQLAEKTDVAGEPVLGLLSLARALLASGDDLLAERLLGAAVQARPQEVVLQNALGKVREWQGRWRDAVECHAVAWALRPELGVNLAEALVASGRVGEGLALFERLSAQRVDNSWLRFVHGLALGLQGRPKEAEAAYREAIRLKPDLPEAHYNLGNALSEQRRYKEAESAYRTVIRLKFDYHQAHHNLGGVLLDQGRPEEAEAAYREAIRLKHDLPLAHLGLGNALGSQRRLKEADAAYRQAIRLKPDDPQTYNNLGNALDGQGRHREAEEAYRQAIRLKHDFPDAHNNLGIALSSQGRYKEAEAAYREAIRLEPDNPKAHRNFGNALLRQDQPQEAELAYREAIRLKHDLPLAHFNLGIALNGQGRSKEAELAYREAIRLKPDYPEAHCNLGLVLLEQGRFGEALPSLRRGHALGSVRPGWRYSSAAWVRQCQRLVELDGMLPGVLDGSTEPASAGERLELASLCQMRCKRLHASATRFAAEAFAVEPKRADDLQNQPRYKAACSAALAAAGQAEDARFVPGRVALTLRRQAYRWLGADLALYAQLVQRDDARMKEAVRQRLRYWRGDATLASVRDKPALARLDADERQQWRQLWQEVDILLQKLGPKKGNTPP
jgi:tetratricopeptide (TPR) repeat protein